MKSNNVGNESVRWSDRYENQEIRLEYEDIPDLNDFLLANATPEGCTNSIMADGFITALLIGPETQFSVEDQGLEIVWGEKPTTTARKKKWSNQKRKMLEVLDGMARRIWNTLDEDDARDYEPLLDISGDQQWKKHKRPPSAVQWCRGFVKAYNICPHAWASIFEDPVAKDVLSTLHFFGSSEGWSRELESKKRYDMDAYRFLFEANSRFYVNAIKSVFKTPSYVVDVREIRDKVKGIWTTPVSGAKVP